MRLLRRGGCYFRSVQSQRPGPTRAGQQRVLRGQLIGLVTGTVLGTVLIFCGLAFGSHPHRVGLGLAVALIFLVLSSAFDWWIYKTSKARVSRLPEDNTRLR